MAREKSIKFYSWKCPKCGSIRISRKGLPLEALEMMEKERRKEKKIFSCEMEICPRCWTPMEQQGECD